MLKKWGFIIWLTGICSAFSSGIALADTMYTPLLTSSMFDGPKADLLLAVNGCLLFVFIVLGLGLITKVLMK